MLIIGCGGLLYNVLLAARALEEEKIGAIVLNCASIKPIDDKKIVELAKKCGAVVTVDARLREFGNMVNARFGEPKLSWPNATTYFAPHHRVGQVTLHRNYITTPRHGKLPIRLVQPREESRYADALKR